MIIEGFIASAYDATFKPSTFLLDVHRADGKTVIDIEDLNSGMRFVVEGDIDGKSLHGKNRKRRQNTI